MCCRVVIEDALTTVRSKAKKAVSIAPKSDDEDLEDNEDNVDVDVDDEDEDEDQLRKKRQTCTSDAHIGQRRAHSCGRCAATCLHE